MTDLYLVYGLSQNVPNFFNAFRSGSVPIGVSNFATYLQLQQGAPELNGRWVYRAHTRHAARRRRDRPKLAGGLHLRHDFQQHAKAG
jgi:hypothetical protein